MSAVGRLKLVVIRYSATFHSVITATSAPIEELGLPEETHCRSGIAVD
jgi:hypothetical protein